MKFFKKQILICKMLLATVFIVLVQNCSIEEDNLTSIDYSEYLSLSKSDFDFGRDWESLSERDKNAFNLAQERMDFTFDENGICTTKWMSSNQVNMSEELFDCFINMIDITNEATKELSEMQGFNLPRLKAGNESSNGSSNGCNPSDYNSRTRNCLVQAIHSLYNKPSYSEIDSWICSRGYYEYNSKVNGWLIGSPHYNTVLYHFLKGGRFLDLNNLTSQCILIIKYAGLPMHAVIFRHYEGTRVNFYDPTGQTGLNDTCSKDDIVYVFKATGVN
jgi:hypothetical protein